MALDAGGPKPQREAADMRPVAARHAEGPWLSQAAVGGGGAGGGIGGVVGGGGAAGGETIGRSAGQFGTFIWYIIGRLPSVVAAAALMLSIRCSCSLKERLLLVARRGESGREGSVMSRTTPSPGERTHRPFPCLRSAVRSRHTRG